MAPTPVDAVWLWRYGRNVFRAAYGRVGGAYTHDYLQTSRRCSETFARAFGELGYEDRYDVRWMWPGGYVDGLVKPGGDYNPPTNLRLNWRWPTSNAPDPWKLVPIPGPIAIFPGDPTKETADEADRELARF